MQLPQLALNMYSKESDIVPYQVSCISQARAVLVFAPHPDDEVFGCGGVLTLHAKAGHPVQVVLLTAGDSNAMADSDRAYADSRLQESFAAASVLGFARPECWGLLDRTLGFGEVLVQRVMQAMQSSEADVIYAPSLWESHPDHRATAMSVIEATRRLGGDRKLFLYEVSATLRPNCLIDITEVWDQKVQAMQCFVSQNINVDYPDFIGSLNRYRALTLQAAVSRAEAFEMYSADALGLPALMPFESEHRRLVARGLPGAPQDNPLVSVIVRTTLRTSLRQSLDSLIAQTYTNMELILVDVQGKGLSGIDLTGITFPIRLASTNAALGRAQAANLGLHEATGDHCIFLDDDDWFYPDHLAKLVNWAVRNPSVKAVHTAVACVDGGGIPSGEIFEFPYAPRELRYGNFMPIHGVLFSRKLVEMGCLFDDRFDLYEDWDFWLQVEQHTPFSFVPGISAAYRIDASSGSGIQVDPERAARATSVLFSKWSIYQTEPVFQDLIKHALARRNLPRQLASLQRHLASAQSQIMDRDAELRRLAALATHQQERAALAEHSADVARQDAHHLREAHDRACTARDMTLGAIEVVRQEARNVHEHALRMATELGTAREETKHLSDSLVQERNNTQDAAHQTLQARAEIAAVKQELAMKDKSLDEMRLSTSWRLTRPVRALGRIVKKVRTVQAAMTVARSRHASLAFIARRALEVFRSEGMKGVRTRIFFLINPAVPSSSGGSEQPGAVTEGRAYSDWIARFDSFDVSQMRSLHQSLAQLKSRPLISIVMPVHNPVANDLTRALESVRAQIYPDWELCICDDASTKPHVKQILDAFAGQDSRIRISFRTENGHISKASNVAIKLATGKYTAFLDHDDELSPHALLRVAQAIAAQPDAKVLYSDEDKLDESGQRFDPYFKPNFNLGLIRSHNYMCHFAVYEAQHLRQLGGLREGFEGAQDYDLALRAVDSIDAGAIVHIPHILYHWRTAVGSTAAGHNQKSYAFSAGQRALNEHLARRALPGTVDEAPEAPGMYRIRWAMQKTIPLVSIVIPTRNGESILRVCLDSLRKTSYPNFEIIVVDNGSDDLDTLAFLSERSVEGQIRIWHDDQPFNFSAINNRAVKDAAVGEFVLLLNNDIEVINPDWLDELVGPAMEPGVGCVGARLWYPDGRLQHGGIILVCGVAGHAHKYLARGRHGYMGRAVLAQDMVGVTAACLLVKKSIYLEVGGLDEGLPVAFNDVDFCLRVHSAGYRNHWTPYAELIHHESVSRGHEDTPEKQQRFRSEIEKMQARWPALLVHDDPCYSPNLTATAEDFSLAWPPRRELP